ncbi:hypothetical protein D623_10022436 [Myotis brandtii]|uniref:Uncharacterized protein n=1 Tax=Myotis brandtii TaxID=109478 RepID=S7NI71_MYOBR|nr:hypothetical protein D623_10022436 [Myotis brandtii]
MICYNSTCYTGCHQYDTHLPGKTENSRVKSDSRNTRLLTEVPWFSKSESSKVLAPLLLGGQVHVAKEESALETKVESVEDPDITREEKLRGQNELAQLASDPSSPGLVPWLLSWCPAQLSEFHPRTTWWFSVMVFCVFTGHLE